MPPKTSFERLLAQDRMELRRERVEMRNGRRRRDAVGVRVFLELQKIEVRSAVRGLCGAGKRARRQREHRDAGRKRDAFLHTREANVEIPFVELDRNAGER